MTTSEIVNRLLDAGFVFRATDDGDATFSSPATETAESEVLRAIVAWQWDALVPHVRQHLAANLKETA